MEKVYKGKSKRDVGNNIKNDLGLEVSQVKQPQQSPSLDLFHQMLNIRDNVANVANRLEEQNSALMDIRNGQLNLSKSTFWYTLCVWSVMQQINYQLWWGD
eukprot:TRINITY_DN95019_c0_g1_i2.p2 TRINITY_DN95019_c0_g1~~TRINITY_DN95019_c0_g1_i2.p2  ORF type:complete len:101 (-),score=9.34 TRINITY_DN95019_c0_g1_i2:204-506(-)